MVNGVPILYTVDHAVLRNNFVVLRHHTSADAGPHTYSFCWRVAIHARPISTLLGYRYRSHQMPQRAAGVSILDGKYVLT
eukprot:scaffold179877_cov39-Tisochrysis_lutea.AAC.1